MRELIGGIWLMTTGDRLRVLVEVDGVWRVAIDEARPFNADGTPMIVSHCANRSDGFYRLPVEPHGVGVTTSPAAGRAGEREG